MKIETEKLTQNQIKNLSPLVLAFIGDGVHTIFVRDFVVKSKLEKLNDYNKDCSHFCKAKTQSLVLDKIESGLSEEEKDIVRRGRNTENHHIAKNANVADYAQSTAFEALIGYLYLNNKERLEELMNIIKEYICI